MTFTRRRMARLSLMAAATTLVPFTSRAASADDEDPFAIPNMFISPCGEPFRGKLGDPYAVVLWFNQADADHDGKLDRSEFVADAAAFFKRIDNNGDGILSREDVLLYEHNIVPEIIGRGIKEGANDGARLWLAQSGGGYSAPIAPEGSLAPGGLPPVKGLDESGNGASPYSFFDEPEPILTADLNVNAVITRANFLKVADMHFTSLDGDGRGYLTLKTLPKTEIQKILLKARRISPAL